MNYEIFVDIVNPIICSFIGGLLTVVGVWLTIKYEKKKDLENQIFNNKPVFYRLDPMQNYDYKSAKDYYFNCDASDGSIKIFGILQNTDKSYFFLDYILINGIKHNPKYGNSVGKDDVICLNIYTQEKLNDVQNISLIVQDVFENKYEYLLRCQKISDNSFSVISIKEKIQKKKFVLKWFKKR